MFNVWKADCSEKSVTKLEEETILDAKNGDSSLISETMAKEEARLLGARVKEEDAEKINKPDEAAELDDNQFTKLDELLTQTQLYTEFLLEKMEDITFVCLLKNLLIYVDRFWCDLFAFHYVIVVLNMIFRMEWNNRVKAQKRAKVKVGRGRLHQDMTL